MLVTLNTKLDVCILNKEIEDGTNFGGEINLLFSWAHYITQNTGASSI